MASSDTAATAGRTGDAAYPVIGATCTLVGSVAFGVVRVLHGDTPAAEAPASLSYVASRPIYAAVHITAVFAALLILAGLISVARSFTHPTATALARFGIAGALVGLAIFGMESSSEGLALPELARAWSVAPPHEQADLVRAAQAVLAGTHGPSLVAIAVLFGLTPVLLGVGLLLDSYPSWLGWAGILTGTATVAAATGEYLKPNLMPGTPIYGLLASILAPAWLFALAVTTLRRCHTKRRPPATPSTGAAQGRRPVKHPADAIDQVDAERKGHRQ